MLPGGRVALKFLIPASLASVLVVAARSQSREPFPSRLGDREFWALSAELSEPAGYFRSDNLVSNEITFQHPVPELLSRTKPGGVYLGVGPDQNFTYIAALKPRIAFIVDIRRLNVMQHLFYKALFELSPDRADFLARLFGRPRPPGLRNDVTPDSLILAYALVAPDSALFVRTKDEIHKLLLEQRGFGLTDEEVGGLDYVHEAFYMAGPDLTYNFGTGRRGGGGFGRSMPSYGRLMMETDADGVFRSYLANEENYGVLRDLQLRNMIVPVTGDFGGPRALRAVGDWVRRHDATITAFYTSNVEQYLFQSEPVWRAFFQNVETLPTDSSSTFIRALFNMGWQFSGSTPGPRSVTVLCPIRTHTREFGAGRLQSYYDVSQCPLQ
ncbi:MAG: LIC_10091 family protein [Gemmatimonadota bacterium]